MPYCFFWSSIKFQGHEGWKIDDLNPICVRFALFSMFGRPDYNDIRQIHAFLAATKQLYKWYFPSVRPSVCPAFTFFSPLRSIPADGFIAWRNFLSVFPFVKLANKSGVATLSVTRNCSMGAIYLTWQGCFRRFFISGAELSKYDFFLQNIAILNTFSSSVNW